MKITAYFLNNKIENIAIYIKKLLSMLMLIVIVICFCMGIKSLKIFTHILNFATNLRQAENIDITVEDVLSAYPLYNKTSYIMKDNGIYNSDSQVAISSNQTDCNISLLDSVMSEDNTKTIEASSKEKQLNLNITNSDSLQTIRAYDMKILNYSMNRSINVEGLFSKVISLTKASDKILLYNTHTSESYANSEKYKFGYNGTYRSTDSNYNMLAIAKEFQKNLDEKSFSVIHDTTPHDYGTYTSAYAKSRVTIKKNLNDIGNFGISIDVHRDAASDLTFAPTVNIKGVEVAQCMFVLGIGTDTNKNEYWEDNLSLAVQLQKIADEYYPGLFRPMIVRNSIYNQDLNKYSILIEVGATGNTIDQAKYATRCLTNILNILYKN